MKLSPTSLEELLTKEHRLRIFNDTVPAGILLISAEDGRMIFANRFFNEILGMDAAAILGSNWRDLFVDPCDRDRLMLRFAGEGEVRNFELRLRARDQREVWGLASMAEIPIEDEDLLLFAFIDISPLKQAEAEIRALADHDPLTGLMTLRRFREEMDHARARAERDGTHFAVMFVDLDHFKAVNDSMGHDAGDLVLRETAHRIRQSIRAADTVARIGGDEFIVLAERVNVPLANTIAERIVHQARQPVALPHGIATIGASVGIAMHPLHGADSHALVKAADTAMYGIKRSTKGAAAFAIP